MEVPRISGSDPAPAPNIEPTPLRPHRQVGSPAVHDAREDRVEVSEQGRDLAQAEAAVEYAEDLRFTLVSRLRATVKAGAYRVDAEALARAMMERGEQE